MNFKLRWIILQTAVCGPVGIQFFFGWSWTLNNGFWPIERLSELHGISKSARAFQASFKRPKDQKKTNNKSERQIVF